MHDGYEIRSGGGCPCCGGTSTAAPAQVFIEHDQKDDMTHLVRPLVEALLLRGSNRTASSIPPELAVAAWLLLVHLSVSMKRMKKTLWQERDFGTDPEICDLFGCLIRSYFQQLLRCSTGPGKITRLGDKQIQALFTYLTNVALP